METDELSFNVFYLLLRNEYRKKYDFALTKCWTICVPCGDSLKEVSITKEFVDDHILKPIPGSKIQFKSTDKNESHAYKIENYEINLINDESDDDYRAKIVSIEKGYNKEFQPYNIIIVDKPLHRKYKKTKQTSESDRLQLNKNVCSYDNALEFLTELPSGKTYMDDLSAEANSMDLHEFKEIEDLKGIVQELIRKCWADAMRQQTLDVQRDARFQKKLSVSLEIFMLHKLHDKLYDHLCNLFEAEDTTVKKKIVQLIDLGVSPDQLGVRESLAIPLPTAMVQLATLDSRKGPSEKLMCMKDTLDFIVAEIKGAMADVEYETDAIDNNSPKNHVLDTDDLIPLLLYVIVKCRTRRLYTDLYYIENFIWSISPHDGLSYTLVTFKAALSLLEQITVNGLPERSNKVKTELELSDLLQVTQTNEAKTPLDKQMQGLAKMLEECMHDSRASESNQNIIMT